MLGTDEQILMFTSRKPMDIISSNCLSLKKYPIYIFCEILEKFG